MGGFWVVGVGVSHGKIKSNYGSHGRDLKSKQVHLFLDFYLRCVGQTTAYQSLATLKGPLGSGVRMMTAVPGETLSAFVQISEYF